MGIEIGGPRAWLRTIKRYTDIRSGKNPAPIFASYFVTFRCNLMCSFCFIRQGHAPELNTDKAKEVVKKICATGVPTLDFSGGEPFLRKDMEELGSLSRSLGCITGVNTNGTLINERRAPAIAGSFDYITISIDGTEQVHDRVRGARGVYAKAKKALSLLRENGARTGISSVVMPSNAEDIMKALDDLKGLYDYVNVQAVMPPVGPSNESVRKLITKINELKASGISVLVPKQFIELIPDYLDGQTPKICDAMKLYFSVDPMGNLLACGARTDITLGNVLERDIMEMLSNPPDEAKKMVDQCSGCWIACTTGTSIAVRKPLAYAKWII